LVLPPAADFRLSFREARDSGLPAGESCMGVAAETVPCRPFELTLQNVGRDTVHIAWDSCVGPLITVEQKEPRSTDGWFPVSEPAQSLCTAPPTWTRVRLKPGESTRFATRLISPQRRLNYYNNLFAPGSYTLRARWNSCRLYRDRQRKRLSRSLAN
jgi:hypothetical protein